VKLAQLAKVRAAVSGVQAHLKINVAAGVERPDCFCTECNAWRVVIVRAVPWLLECYDSATTSLPGSVGDLS
jgi:hypothetical protein